MFQKVENRKRRSIEFFGTRGNSNTRPFYLTEQSLMALPSIEWSDDLANMIDKHSALTIDVIDSNPDSSLVFHPRVQQNTVVP
jgi:hypothetical protein